MKDITPKPVQRKLEIEADVYPVDAIPLFLSVAGGNFTGENIEGSFDTGVGGASIIVHLTKPEKRTVVVSARAVIAAVLGQVVGERAEVVDDEEKGDEEKGAK